MNPNDETLSLSVARACGWPDRAEAVAHRMRRAASYRQALMAPLGSLLACAALVALPQVAPVQASWERINAQTLIAVDTAEVRLDGFGIRLDSLEQVNIEDSLALMTGASKGDVREELECLAQNIYFEARSEPKAGRLAVAHVVMNRKASNDFPSSVCEVVKDGGEDTLNRCQFSWWCDGKSDAITDLAAWKDSVRLASKVYWGRVGDPTGGALWYHADYVKPFWRTAFKQGPKIGRHIFYSIKPKLYSNSEKPAPEVLS